MNRVGGGKARRGILSFIHKEIKSPVLLAGPRYLHARAVLLVLPFVPFVKPERVCTLATPHGAAICERSRGGGGGGKRQAAGGRQACKRGDGMRRTCRVRPLATPLLRRGVQRSRLAVWQRSLCSRRRLSAGSREAGLMCGAQNKMVFVRTRVFPYDMESNRKFL